MKKAFISIMVSIFFIVTIGDVANAASDRVLTILENNVVNPNLMIDASTTTFTLFPQGSSVKIEFDKPINPGAIVNISTIMRRLNDTTFGSGTEYSLYAADGTEVNSSGNKKINGSLGVTSTANSTLTIVANAKPAKGMILYSNNYTSSGGSKGFSDFNIYDISFTVSAEPPSKPDGLAVIVGDRSLGFSWNAVAEPDIVGYNVYRNGVKLNTTPLTATSYLMNGLINGTTYNLQVAAVDSAGLVSQLSVIQGTPRDNTIPDIPTGITAAPDNAEVVINWIANTEPDIAGYNLYRDGVKINTVLITVTNYKNTGLTNGVTYTYSLTAVDTSGNESELSEGVPAKPDTDVTPPAVPTLSANPGNARIQLMWTVNTEPDLAGYNLYRDGVKINTVLLTDNELMDTGLTNFQSYSYQITAVDIKENESEKSAAVIAMPEDPDLTPPAAPTGLSGTPGDSEVLLGWITNKEFDLAGYNVYRDGVKINTGLITGTSYTDKGRTNETVYSYRITAVDIKGNESIESAEVSATPFKSIVPKNVQANSGTNRMVVTWNAVADATEYYIYRDGVLVETTSENRIYDSDVVNGTSYTYYVIALVDGFISDPSLPASATVGQVIEFPSNPDGFPKVIAVFVSAFAFAGLFAPYIVLILSLMLTAALISFNIWLFNIIKKNRAWQEVKQAEMSDLRDPQIIARMEAARERAAAMEAATVERNSRAAPSTTDRESRDIVKAADSRKSISRAAASTANEVTVRRQRPAVEAPATTGREQRSGRTGRSGRRNGRK